MASLFFFNFLLVLLFAFLSILITYNLLLLADPTYRQWAELLTDEEAAAGNWEKAEALVKDVKNLDANAVRFSSSISSSFISSF